MFLWSVLLISLLLVARYNSASDVRKFALAMAVCLVTGTGLLALNDHYNGPGTHPVSQG